MRRIAAALYGALAYLAFLIPIGYLVGFLADAGVPKTVNGGAGPLGPALAVDLALLLAFGLQHSVMARPGFKRAIERWVPRSMERSTYVLVSGLLLLAIFWLWRPIPAVLWDVAGTPLGALAWAGYAAGWGLAVWATFALSHFHLFGVSQVAAYVGGREHPRMALRSTLLYRLVRHPMTTGLLLAFWSTPRMTVGHLVFAAGMTAYSLVATVLEERDLIRQFGDGYRAYRREVPALIPILRPGALLPRGAGLAVELAILTVLLALAAAVTLTDAGAEPAPVEPGVNGAPVSLGTVEVEHGGVRRGVRVYDPAPDTHVGHDASEAPVSGALATDAAAAVSGSGSSLRPLVLALHGTGGDADRLRAYLGGALERAANEHGWLVAYPEAVDGRWNDCRRAGSRARTAGIDDVGFLRAVVRRLARTRGADPGRVFLLGYSGGGHMAFRVALEDGSLARGMAVFGASLPTDPELLCRDTGEPVATLLVNGHRDLINPVGGGDVIAPDGRPLGTVRSARAAIAYFKRRPGYAPARLVLVDGGHAVPGPDGRFPRIAGRVVRSYHGVREALAFFDDVLAGGPPSRSHRMWH